MTRDIPDMDMQAWRAAIDRLDDEILKLIQQRLALAEEVGKSKVRGGLAWRPAREAQLFARLVGRASATLSASAVERLWSTVIAQSLQAQGPAFLVISRSDPHLRAQARTFFGLLPMVMVANDDEAIRRSAAEEGAIAIVPAPDAHSSWWAELVPLQSTGNSAPAVLAALPRFAGTQAPKAYAVASAPRETTGNDFAWYVKKGAMGDMPQGTVLAKDGDLSLLAYDGNAAPKERDGLFQIGLFAKPLKKNAQDTL